jgi:hypothetical protein
MNEYENKNRTTLEALFEAARTEWIDTSDSLRAASKTVAYLKNQECRARATMAEITEVLDMIDAQDA